MNVFKHRSNPYLSRIPKTTTLNTWQKTVFLCNNFSVNHANVRCFKWFFETMKSIQLFTWYFMIKMHVIWWDEWNSSRMQFMMNLFGTQSKCSKKHATLTLIKQTFWLFFKETCCSEFLGKPSSKTYLTPHLIQKVRYALSKYKISINISLDKWSSECNINYFTLLELLFEVLLTNSAYEPCMFHCFYQLTRYVTGQGTVTLYQGSYKKGNSSSGHSAITLERSYWPCEPFCFYAWQTKHSDFCVCVAFFPSKIISCTLHSKS